MSTVLLNNLVLLETNQQRIQRLHPTITSKHMQILIKTRSTQNSGEKNNILLKRQKQKRTTFNNNDKKR